VVIGRDAQDRPKDLLPRDHRRIVHIGEYRWRYVETAGLIGRYRSAGGEPRRGSPAGLDEAQDAVALGGTDQRTDLGVLL